MLMTILFCALLLDMILGDPPNRFHPVCLMGWWAHTVEKIVYPKGDSHLFGTLAYLLVVIPPFSITVFLLAIIPSSLGMVVVATLFLYLFFAPKGLAVHAQAVAKALDEETLDEARKSVAMLVGRKTEKLDVHGVARATIESVAENLTDGVLSPLFWFSVGFMVYGPRGAVLLLLLYRLTNTLDSMWGHKNKRYHNFGTVPAKMDDILNYIPARMGSILVLFVFPTKAELIFRVVRRDRGKHESPNAPWTEAAFAGALGLQLNGPVDYGNRIAQHPWIGDGKREASVADIRAAIALMWLSTLYMVLILSALTLVIEDIIIK